MMLPVVPTCQFISTAHTGFIQPVTVITIECLQVHLSENRIGKVETEAFGGMFTIGSIHLQSNQIGRIEPRAFTRTENLGSLTLSYNSIREPIESAECLENEASRFVFTENNLYCTCEMRWIQLYYQVRRYANYCAFIVNTKSSGPANPSRELLRSRGVFQSTELLQTTRVSTTAYRA